MRGAAAAAWLLVRLPWRYRSLRRRLRDDPLAPAIPELAVASLRCGCDIDDPGQFRDLVMAFVLAKDCRRKYLMLRMERILKEFKNE